MKPSTGDAVLLTGATGLVGGQILARYLEGGARHVYAIVRAPTPSAAAYRLGATLASIYGSKNAYRDRITPVPGDLQRPGLGLTRRRRDELAEHVSDVVHAAATVSFSESVERARAVNVIGTERTLELAALCERRGGLRQFSHVSTAFVGGTFDGHFGEDDLDVRQSFRNPYERSKFEAERMVHRWAERIPVRVFRPGIIVGEQLSGWTPVFNTLYYPIKLFAKGVNAPIVPARREARVDLVPIDYVADAIFDLAARPGRSGEAFHLVAGPDASTLGELLDTAARYFCRRPPLLIPLGPYLRPFHPILNPILKLAYPGGVRGRQLARSLEFLPYFDMRQTFDDTRARRALESTHLRAPSIASYFDRLANFAVAAEWGRRSISRAEARSMVATATDSSG